MAVMTDEAPAKSPLLQKMCERCIERDKDLPECRERRYFCDFYICSEQPKKRRAHEEVTDEKISVEVNKLIRKGNSKNTSMIMVASRFGLGMAVIRSRYARHETTKKKAKNKSVKKQVAARSAGTKAKTTTRKKATARRETSATPKKENSINGAASAPRKKAAKKTASTGRLKPPAKKNAKKKAVKKTAARKKK